MGVSKFITSFVKPIPNSRKECESTCVAFFADLNQEIYTVLNFFAIISGACKPKGNEENEKTKTYVYQGKGDPYEDYRNACIKIVQGRIKILKRMNKLREIYLAMDGTPCIPKIQQQIIRRKSPSFRFVNKKGDFLFSDAMVLPGTRLTQIFSDCCSELFGNYIRSFNEKQIANGKSHDQMSLIESYQDIQGEGEHKILDMVRRVKYLNYAENKEGKSILLLSIDSDTIISLLHQKNYCVYIETEVTLHVPYNPNLKEDQVQFTKEIRTVKISEIRDGMASNEREASNIPFILGFVGNDFNAAMLDTIELREYYFRAKEFSSDLRFIKTYIDDDKIQYQVINFKDLEEFLKRMSRNELDLYYSRIKTDASTDINPKTREAQFKGKTPDETNEKIAFKDKYYRQMYQNYKKHVLCEIPPDDKDEFEITTDEVYKFELEVATSYLKTFVWYYYYQSGYSVKDPLNNSYYPYGYPPLYNSLYLVFFQKEFKQNISILNQFSHEYNKDLLPVLRDVDYWENLPKYSNNNELHHLCVLQEEELSSIYPKGLPYNDSFFRYEKEKPVFIASEYQTRIPRYIKITLCPIINVHKIFELYGKTSESKNNKKQVTGEIPKSFSTKNKSTVSKYTLSEGELDFGNLPNSY